MSYIFRVMLLFFLSLLHADEYIENYLVDIYLKQDGSLQITENIDYHFGDRFRHGIYRDIPTMSEIDSGLKRNIGLHDFSVYLDHKIINYEHSMFGNVIRIKIGDPDQVISGTHRYMIDYKEIHGVSSKGERDALRWNAVGTGWEIPIRGIKTTVHFPKTLSRSSVHAAAFTGGYGSKVSDALLQWQDIGTLVVTADALNPSEGMTVEVAFARDALGQNGLPSIFERSMQWFKNYWSWLFALLLWFLMHWFWRRNGRNAPKTVVVRYKPPASLDILQAGLLLNRFSENRDFSAAVVDMARRGYLRIVKRKRALFLERMEKHREDYGFYQRQFFHVLFRRSGIVELSGGSGRGAIPLSRGIGSLKNALYDWAESDGYMMENPQTTRRHFLITIKILFALFALLVLFDTLHRFGMHTAGTVAATLFLSGIALVFIFQRGSQNKLIGSLLFAAALAIASVSMEKTFTFSFASLIVTPYPALLLALLPSRFYYKNLGKYTKKGAEVHAHLLGYKEFIKRVERDEVRQRLADDPDFLNETLPYAMLFGYVKKWIGLLAALEVDMSQWELDDPRDLNDAFSASNAMFDNIASDSSIDDSSTSDFSSGSSASSGSYSGGGSGGGGGGSW
jgi:uncharacterized membrane protein YgcG